MTNEQFDQFLDDATHAVANLWPDKMGSHELYALNDVLTQFFADKRDYEPPQSLTQRTTVITADDPDFA